MKKYFLSIILVVSTINLLQSQIKIGTNPQNIDGASVLELESNNRVLVITRVSDAQMNAITPLQGALIYNTDEECVFYYNGTTWENLCTELNTFNVDFSIVGEDLVLTDSNGDTVSVPLSDLGVSVFTSNPIFNPVDNDNTIVITENADNVNIEVGEITGFNIVDSSINGFLDIQTGSIVNSNLQDDAVDRTKIDANIAGIGLVQAPDGSLDIDVTEFSGTGTLSSPTNTLEITGNPVNSIFNSIGLDVADDAITQAKIADNAVGTNEIINGAVTTDKILDTNVTASKIAADVAGTGLTQAGNGALQVDVTAFTGDGAISSPDNSITLTGTPATAALEDVNVEVNVDGTTLEVDASNGVQVRNDGITTDKIAPGAVESADIAVDAVNAVTINPDVAGTGLIQNAGTGALEVDPTAITADGDITSTDLAVTGGVGAAINDVTLEINAGAVGNTEIAADAITTDKIAAGAVASTDIAVDAVNAITINPDVAGTGLIQNAGTGALEVDPTAITADGDITSTDLAVTGGVGATINDVTLEINAGAVDNTEIADNAVTSAKINDGEIVDADVSGTAAIVGTKINPNFGTLPVSTTGTLASGNTTITGTISTTGTATIGANTITAIDGTNGQVLTTDGAGNATWINPADATATGTTGSIFFADGANGFAEDNAQLFWDDASNRLGVGTNAIGVGVKLRVANGDIQAEGILNTSVGAVDNPPYSFNTDDDTGMWRDGADELVLVAGGREGLRIDMTAAVTTTTIPEILELDGPISDINNNTGTAGQILSSTGNGTAWVNPPLVILGKVEGTTGNALKINGAMVVRNSPGNYTVTFNTPRADTDYIIQLTLSSAAPGSTIQVVNQATASFDVQIFQPQNIITPQSVNLVIDDNTGPATVDPHNHTGFSDFFLDENTTFLTGDADWFFTVTDF